MNRLRYKEARNLFYLLMWDKWLNEEVFENTLGFSHLQVINTINLLWEKQTYMYMKLKMIKCRNSTVNEGTDILKDKKGNALM